MKPFYGSISTANVNHTTNEIENAISQALVQKNLTDFIFYNVEPDLINGSRGWEVIWTGSVSGSIAQSSSNYIPRYYNFRIADSDLVISNIASGEKYYQWTCPYPQTQLSVYHNNLVGGPSITSMTAVNPSQTRTGNYELVDYCGPHTYNYNIKECICPPCIPPYPLWCSKYSYTSKISNQFTDTSGSVFREQDAFYFGEWIRQYYLNRTYIYYNKPYSHKFNIMANLPGGDSLYYGYMDLFVRRESSATIPSIGISHIGGFSDISHEYNHLILDHVRPDGLVVCEGLMNSTAIEEAIGAIYQYIPFSSTYPPSVIYRKYVHQAYSNKACDVISEGSGNCICDTPGLCMTCSNEVHDVGVPFVQSFLEIYYNRSYGNYHCQNDNDCYQGYCDTDAASNTCYWWIGPYSQTLAEEALWIALENVPQISTDFNQLASYVLWLIWYGSGGNQQIWDNIVAEFNNHQIYP